MYKIEIKNSRAAHTISSKLAVSVFEIMVYYKK